MVQFIKSKTLSALRWSERYTKTDMVYFASGNFWLSISRIISVGSGLLLTYAFANFLTPEEFGRYKYVISLAGFIGAFSLSGLNGAVTRAVAQGKEHVVRSVFKIGVRWSLPASMVSLGVSIYYFAQNNTELGIGLLLIAFTNPFLNNLVLTKSIFVGKKDFKGLTYFGAIRGLIPTIIMLATLFITESVLSVLIAYFISNLIMSWISFEQAMKRFGIQSKENDVKETVAYGKHMSIIGGISQMVGNIDQLLLWHVAGPVQLAVYSFALAPIRELRNFSENIHPLIFPKYATKTVTELKKSIPLRVSQMFIASLCVAITYILLAPFLYKFIFPQYLSSILASQLFALSLLLQPKNIIETMLYTQGDTKLRYITTFATQGSKILFWIFLIPTYGFLGAAIGTVLGDIVSALVLWWAYRKTN